MIRLEEDTWEALRDEATKDGRSMTSYLNRHLRVCLTLKPLSIKLKGNVAFSEVLAPETVKAGLAEGFKAAEGLSEAIADIEFCKHGANPKFCRFAKGGKPCR